MVVWERVEPPHQAHEAMRSTANWSGRAGIRVRSRWACWSAPSR